MEHRDTIHSEDIMERVLRAVLEAVAGGDSEDLERALGIGDVEGCDELLNNRVNTYEENGILTHDRGLVVSFPSGNEFQITIKQSRYGDRADQFGDDDDEDDDDELREPAPAYCPSCGVNLAVETHWEWCDQRPGEFVTLAETAQVPAPIQVAALCSMCHANPVGPNTQICNACMDEVIAGDPGEAHDNDSGYEGLRGYDPNAAPNDKPKVPVRFARERGGRGFSMFQIIVRCKHAMRRAGWSEEEITAFRDRAMSWGPGQADEHVRAVVEQYCYDNPDAED